MNNSKYQAIIHKVDSFPSLPITVTKVIEVVGNPESSAQDLMQAITPDQAMCATVLKIANSAFFGRPKEVSSLETAVMVLGFNEIQSIVLGRALFNSFKKISNKHQEMESFWQHSFTCGVSAKIIAENIRLSQGELFIAGLIHDIGKLALLIAFPNDYKPSVWLQNLQCQEMLNKEKETFSMGHDEVGGKLLKRWFFPEKLVASVEMHHTKELDSPLATYALIVQLADILAFFHQNNKLEIANIESEIAVCNPQLKDNWLQHNLPWDVTSLNRWYNDLWQTHDTGVLDLLSS